METLQERNNQKGKAIVEESGDRLPLPKLNNRKDDDLHYIKFLGKQQKFTKSVGTDSSSDQIQRLLFRIRNKEVGKVLGKDDERIKNIHTVSGATIGILSDTAAQIHRHVYLELLGTLDEVKIAELLIEDAIAEEYEKPFAPTALMPTCICHHRMIIPLFKVVPLLGFDGNNILKLENESGAWIEVDTFDPPPGGNAWQRAVDLYGHEIQVTSAITMIQKTLSEYRDLRNTWDMLVGDVEPEESVEEDEHQNDSAMGLVEEDEHEGPVEKAGPGEEAAEKESALLLFDEAEAKGFVEKAGSGEGGAEKDSGQQRCGGEEGDM